MPPPTSAAHHFPAGVSVVSPTTANTSTHPSCSVSADGLVWYRLPQGPFPPIDFSHVSCAQPSIIAAGTIASLPLWSQRPPATEAIFVATSLQETYRGTVMGPIEALAANAKVPVTWMIGDAAFLSPGGIAQYAAAHASNGDDVELEQARALYALARGLPWYAPAVSVEGAGRERNVPGLTALGNDAFWGITWNSHGTDSTSDEGAPWGAYCADATSYKRPDPSGTCKLLSFEWTARDLTRAYFQDTNPSGYSSEAAFSTDPDDVLQRGDFGTAAAVDYERSLIDAYAAAGATQPIVVMSQQETNDEAQMPADDPVLSAIYGEAVASGMAAMTLREADVAARAFAAAPRAIAFPFVPGGLPVSYDGAPFTPATIDYHDTAAGMTFVSGHSLPDRVFAYADDPVSLFNRPLAQIGPGDASYPKLVSVTAAGGTLRFAFDAPAAMRFGVAVWSDPQGLSSSSPSLTVAGHAGYVVAFDLPQGASTQVVPCTCTSATLSYSP